MAILSWGVAILKSDYSVSSLSEKLRVRERDREKKRERESLTIGFKIQFSPVLSLFLSTNNSLDIPVMEFLSMGQLKT